MKVTHDVVTQRVGLKLHPVLLTHTVCVGFLLKYSDLTAFRGQNGGVLSVCLSHKGFIDERPNNHPGERTQHLQDQFCCSPSLPATIENTF